MRTLRVLIALAALLVGLGCAGDRSEESPTATQLSPPDHTYPLRGQVVALPRPESTKPTLSVHHEAVPEFVSRGGEVVGMEAMTMSFVVADEVDLTGIEVGDRVEATLEIRWTEGDPATLVDVREVEAPPGDASP